MNPTHKTRLISSSGTLMAIAASYYLEYPAENTEFSTNLVIKGIPTFSTLRATFLLAAHAEKDTVLFHEAGHALANIYLDDSSLFEEIVINENNTGHVYSVNPITASVNTKEELFNRLVLVVAGKMAEIHKYGSSHKPTGCRSDYKRAKIIAKALLGKTGTKSEINALIKQAEAASTELMTERNDELHDLVNALRQKPKLDRREVFQVLGLGNGEGANKHHFPDLEETTPQP